MCAPHRGVLIVICLLVPLSKAAGEPTLILDKLHKLVEPKDIVQSDINFDKSGDEIKISGEVMQLVDMDNKWMVNVTILRSDSEEGNYRMFMKLPIQGACQILRTYYKDYFYDKLKEAGNVPHPNTCPITADTYVIKDYTVDSTKLRKFLKPGYYRTYVIVSCEKEEKLNYLLEAHVD